MKIMVPRGQLDHYQVGFESEEHTSKGEFIRTTRTTAIDTAASIVTKEVIAGKEYPEDK